MGSKIDTLIPEDLGNWQKFTVMIERKKSDGNYKLSINGEDSDRGRTFRMGISSDNVIESITKVVTQMEKQDTSK
jgi:hypothetical protein